MAPNSSAKTQGRKRVEFTYSEDKINLEVTVRHVHFESAVWRIKTYQRIKAVGSLHTMQLFLCHCFSFRCGLANVRIPTREERTPQKPITPGLVL